MMQQSLTMKHNTGVVKNSISSR